MKHTPTPWHSHDGMVYDLRSGDTIATMNGGADGSPCANATRIAAAVNACEGIPTVALEQGVVKDMQDALEMILAADGDLYAIDFNQIRDALNKSRGAAA